LLEGSDRVGLVNEITQIISNELKVNIRKLSFDTEDGIFEGRITLFVNDTEHLEGLLIKLRNIQGLVNVTRFDS